MNSSTASLTQAEILLESIAAKGLKETIVGRAEEDMKTHGNGTAEIDRQALSNLCSEIPASSLCGCTWCSAAIPTGPELMVLGDALVYFTLLNSVNYCFWVFPGEKKWNSQAKSKHWDGALGLFAAMTAALERHGARGLAEITSTLDRSGFDKIFNGPGVLRLIPNRISMLREAGQVLSSVESPAEMLFGDPPWQVEDFISRLLVLIPSYADPYLKRAQLLVAMLHGHLASQGVTLFEGLDTMTLFSDYKVPQTLERNGIIKYGSSLKRSLASHEQVPRGSGFEAAIRAATILSGEELMKTLAKKFNHKADATKVDFMLWLKAQEAEVGSELPYHRTETTDY